MYDGDSAGAGGVGYGARGSGIIHSKNNSKKKKMKLDKI